VSRVFWSVGGRNHFRLKRRRGRACSTGSEEEVDDQDVSELMTTASVGARPTPTAPSRASSLVTAHESADTANARPLHNAIFTSRRCT